MKDLEFNKIAAAILVAGLIALISGKITSALYKPELAKKRGFEIEVADAENAGKTAKEKVEEKIDIAALMSMADIEKGKTKFKSCVACHNATPGSAHKVGPSLGNVVGAKIAAASDYNYSNALKEIDKKWTYEELFAFLKKPKKYAPGTKMGFIGVKKPQDIAHIVAYLRSVSDNPPALP